jgi:hypothetical protein
MFNSKTLLVGMLVEGNILEKYISKSVNGHGICSGNCFKKFKLMCLNQYCINFYEIITIRFVSLEGI